MVSLTVVKDASVALSCETVSTISRRECRRVRTSKGEDCLMSLCWKSRCSGVYCEF